MTSQIKVREEALDVLNDAISKFEEKTNVKVVQTTFLEYLLRNPDEISQIALRGYKKHIMKLNV